MLPVIESTCVDYTTVQDSGQLKEAGSFAKVMTAHIRVETDKLLISFTDIAGTGGSFAMGLEDTLADLESHIRTTQGWQAMKFFAATGDVLGDMCQALTSFDQLAVMNSEDEHRFNLAKAKYPSVGKVLAAMKIEAFNPSSEKFDVTWRLGARPDINQAEFDALLVEILEDESLVSHTHFIQVLGYLIHRAEAWNMMNLQLLQNFDPGLKIFKHCWYKGFLKIARMAATLPVVPMSPPLVATFSRNSRNNIVAARLEPYNDDYPLDRNVINSWHLNADALWRDWSKATCEDLVAVLQHMDTLMPLDHIKPSRPLALSNQICLTLMSLQLRLVSDVCPVWVQGDLSVDPVNLLAESSRYYLTVLGSTGDPSELRFCAITDDLHADSKNASGESLAACVDSAVAKASAADFRGSLVFVGGVLRGSVDLLSSLCRRLKDAASPHSLRFVLCLQC